MSWARHVDAWPRLRYWAEEAWGRHVRYRELYRQLDQMRAAYKARTAWVDELTEEDGAAFLRRLAERGGDVRALPIHRENIHRERGSNAHHS